jgi:hypothetical protein
MPKLSCLAGGVAAMLTVSAAAAPLDRYTGSFDAEGVVADGPHATPQEVKCDFEVLQRQPNQLALDGTCWAYLIFSRSVSADLSLNPQTGRMTGTYTGAKVGPARLTGQLAGLAIDLLISWPQPVNGHMTAGLRIVSLGPDRLRILVTDGGEHGVPRVTTDLSLARR